jgi:hypothetical protein
MIAVSPITFHPASTSSTAATALSTPPLMPTATVPGLVVLESSVTMCDTIVVTFQ